MILQDDDQGASTAFVLTYDYRHKVYNRRLTNSTATYSNEPNVYQRETIHVMQVVLP